MALFKKPAAKKTAKAAAPKKEKAVAVKKEAASTATRAHLAHILKHARITEKASLQQLSSVYVFDVASDATKTQIDEAVRSIYGVSPRKITVVNTPSKTKRSARTGKTGVTGGGRKAYVYLTKGETITIA